MKKTEKTNSSASNSSQKDIDLIELALESMREKSSLAEETGITTKQIEALYALGFKLYQAECFPQAADIFRLLCFYEPRNSRNWIALGGANQHTKNHYSAAAAFAMASMYDPLNPEPKFYSAHCFIDLMNLPLALQCAETSLHLCKSSGENSIRPRVQALCNALVAHLASNKIL
ncbi:MAG: hypothetical protein ACH346_05130 [Chthoniobacterales bacterium]